MQEAVEAWRMAARRSWFNKSVVLGWKVTKAFDPYYFDDDAKLGEHSQSHIVKTAPSAMAHHTIIVAQSGSGKSFFLGRVVEEILLKTRSRVVILDMNSDFRKIAEAKKKEFWKKKGIYDREKRAGFLAEEPSRKDFIKLWKPISKTVFSMRSGDGEEYPTLSLNWFKVPVEFLVDGSELARRDQLRQCHRLVAALSDIARLPGSREWLEGKKFLSMAREFCENTDEFRSEEFRVLAALDKAFGQRSGLDGRIPSVANMFDQSRHPEPYLRAAMHRRNVPQEAVEFYFTRATEVMESGFIDNKFSTEIPKRTPDRVEVVDIPSIADQRHRKVAVCTVLETEWDRARDDWVEALTKDAKQDKRVPTFIVVEEAHNVIPASASDPVDILLVSLFRRIAAEGRKLGLFLVLVSQSPDKLDRSIMSECENRAVMRVGSSMVLRKTCEILGLDSIVPKMTEEALEFDLGRALLVGPWASDEPVFLLSAARRTVEGGRDLRAKYWARLPEDPIRPGPKTP